MSYGALIQDLPNSIVSLNRPYADGYISTRHKHERHQMLYATSGMMMAETDTLRCAVPAGYGMFIPAGCVHQISMIGTVKQRSLYLNPETLDQKDLPPCRTFLVSPLMTALIDDFCKLDNPWPVPQRAYHLAELIVLELLDATPSALALPLPTHRRLLSVCRALISNPACRKSIDDWAGDIGMSRRAFTRTFRDETGLSFGAWTQLMTTQIALQFRSNGKSLERAASELGYASQHSLRKMMRKFVDT